MEKKVLKTCDACGNSYDKTFEVISGGSHYDFDCFECAVHLLAPRCGYCDLRVMGHGVEVDEKIFCCAHCARSAGEKGLLDRREAGSVVRDKFAQAAQFFKR